jgi:hypothetical protein
VLNQEVLEYVNDVMTEIAAPEEFKDSLRKELIRVFEHTSIDEIMNKMGPPKRFANEISRKLAYKMSEDFDCIITKPNKQNTDIKKASRKSHGERGSKKPYGEYTLEESHVNLKLLYIPLIQISSGTEKIHYYLTDDDDDECDNE